MREPTRVYLESGRRWVFACACDWPGWCRRARDEDAALAALDSYAARYGAIAGPGFDPGELVVVGRLAGDATTDFGAPGAIGPWDTEGADAGAIDRGADVLVRAWRRFDDVVRTAPAALRLGPRGGGRDRDAVVEHVRVSERSYARKIDVRLAPSTVWPEQRGAIIDALRTRAEATRWPLRYALRRMAWHVVDHVWEIEDRSD